MYADKRRRRSSSVPVGTPTGAVSRPTPAGGGVAAGPLTRIKLESDLSANGRRLAVVASAQRLVGSDTFDVDQVATRIAGWALLLASADGVTMELREGMTLSADRQVGCCANRSVPAGRSPIRLQPTAS